VSRRNATSAAAPIQARSPSASVVSWTRTKRLGRERLAQHEVAEARGAAHEERATMG
jgi:hypothetical protein